MYVFLCKEKKPYTSRRLKMSGYFGRAAVIIDLIIILDSSACAGGIMFCTLFVVIIVTFAFGAVCSRESVFIDLLRLALFNVI